VTLAVRIQDDGHQVHASVVSLTYTTGAGSKTMTPANNSLDFHWPLDRKPGALKRVEQLLQVGSGHGDQGQLLLQAHYDAR